jgi:hypothetical protein
MNQRAKINFEVDQASLANAKAYVARHGGSLNKLVSSLFASLGHEDRLTSAALDPTRRVLLDASAGKISVVEAADLLALPDAGYVLQRLVDHGLPLPRLTDDEVSRQAAESFDALRDCLSAPTVAPSPRRSKPALAQRRK